MLWLCVWELWFEAVLLKAFFDIEDSHLCVYCCSRCGPGYPAWINGVSQRLSPCWQAPR